MLSRVHVAHVCMLKRYVIRNYYCHIFDAYILYSIHIFAGNCTSYPECETIWNTDVRTLYKSLTSGTLRTD